MTPPPDTAEHVRATEPDMSGVAQLVGATRAPPKQMGSYEIVCRLAVGGMAEIYLARKRAAHGFAKHVVVKRILPHYAADPRFVQMFLDEARLAAKLQHPNIGQVYDIGQHDDTYFFAMEYLHGADVRELCREALASGARVPLEHALAIVSGAAAGLDYAHEQTDADGQPLHLVHRDVSPSNIVVTYDGVVKLVDFGIARATTRTHDTNTGTLRGKLAYMSPEQCKRQKLDRRADIFALGVVLYELTTGQRLFRHGAESDYLVMSRIVHGDVPPPTAVTPGYPAALEKIVLRALATDRDQRYGRASELMAELQAFARDQKLVSTPSSLAAYVRELTGDRPEPWRDEFDPDDSDRTFDDGAPPPVDRQATEREPITMSELATGEIATSVLRVMPRPPAPLTNARLASESDEMPTLDAAIRTRVTTPMRVATSRAATTRSPHPRRRRRRLTAWPLSVVMIAVPAVIIGAFAAGGSSVTPAPAEPAPARATAPASAPIAAPLPEPIIEPIEAPQPTLARRASEVPAPEPTVTSLADDTAPIAKPVAKPQPKPKTARKTGKKTRKNSLRKRRTKKRRARAAAQPVPRPKEDPKWNPDSPLLPSRLK